MPNETLLPTSIVSLGGWVGVVASIDEGVDSHNGDVDYVEYPADLGSGPGDSALRIAFQNPTITSGPYTEIRVRVIRREADPLNDPASMIARLYNGATLLQESNLLASGSYTEAFFEYSGSLSSVDDLELVIFPAVFDLYLFKTRVTAVELVVTTGSSGGNQSLAFSDTVVFGDVWTVAGPGASTSISWSDSVIFTDAWSLTSTGGGGGGSIGTGRTDIACRSCGTIVQVTESLVFIASGYAVPVTWDGVSASATTVPNAPLLPFPAAFREKVFLYGELAYGTGTVQTVSGITQIQFSTAPPANVLGKGITIEGVTFGTNESCQSTITVVNGVLATLSVAPNQNFAAAPFAIFGGSGGSQLQWSADNDHTTWTDPALAVGKLDGDLSTGAFTLGNFLILTKRSHTYRFDFDIDPNDPAQRALSIMSETRGLVANRSAVVVEGTAYMMDAQPNYFWVTRGGALFPLDIGRQVRNLLDAGGEYEPDWTKSSCWFGWYSPIPKSICWAFTKLGESYPRFAAEYMAPNIEGGDESGRWSIREYHHYILGAVNATGDDGVSRPYLVCADRDKPDSMFLVADSNVYGDMATGSSTGTVVKQISNTVLQLPKHTAFHVGSLIEINRQTRTVISDDTVNVEVSLAWTVVTERKKYRAGYRARAVFKTIDISPEPGWAQVSVDQIHCLLYAPNPDCELTLGVFSDGSTNYLPILAGAKTSSGEFRKDDRLATISPGITGFQVAISLTLLSPGGTDGDEVFSCDIIRNKRTDPSQGWPSPP